MEPLSDFQQGYLLGLLVAAGSFGGTGKEPQILLRMHTRHAELFHWLERALPGARLYGPYLHAGRAYFQWSARGAFLRQHLVPLLAKHANWLDAHARERFHAMCRRYGMSPQSPEGPGLSTPPEEEA